MPNLKIASHTFNVNTLLFWAMHIVFTLSFCFENMTLSGRGYVCVPYRIFSRLIHLRSDDGVDCCYLSVSIREVMCIRLTGRVVCHYLTMKTYVQPQNQMFTMVVAWPVIFQSLVWIPSTAPMFSLGNLFYLRCLELFSASYGFERDFTRTNVK